jgi:hypothetical protein
METVVKVTYFFINMELSHHLLVTQLVSFLGQTRVSSLSGILYHSSSSCLRGNGRKRFKCIFMLVAVCMANYRLEKLHHCLETTPERTWLPEMST